SGLLRQPADEPDVDIGVAVELVVEALGGVVALERLPQHLRLADLDRKPRELRPIQVPVGGKTLANPGCDVRHDKSLLGLSAVISFTTESPKPRMALSVGADSITGTSLP